LQQPRSRPSSGLNVLDIRLLREDSASVVRGLLVRGIEGAAAQVEALLTLDTERREAVGRANDLRASRNDVSKRIGQLKRAGEDAESMIAEMKKVGDEIDALDARLEEIETKIDLWMMSTPNVPLPEVDPGGEDSNKILRVWGKPPEFDFEPKPHWELGKSLGILELERGSKVSGSGFPVLKGAGARLQRALINWMLDLHTARHGYEELRVPYLVTRETMTGTGQLPKFEEESYQSERDGLWLIPTAEVPVTNLHRDELLEAEDLPVRYTAVTPCFRREAGAAGRDTRGLLRVHQFDKVELVRYERAERSREALEEMTQEACAVLEAFGLHYRVVRLAGGDLGFSAAMTYDLEVWAPGVGQWLEASSVSTCNDFQARRANLRFRPAQAEKPQFVHTLNGSALALPRLMIALLETYQNADGTVTVPEALREALGRDRIEP